MQLVTVRAGRDRRQAERPDQVASGFAHDRQLRNLQRRHVQIPARREHAFGNVNHHIRQRIEIGGVGVLVTYRDLVALKIDRSRDEFGERSGCGGGADEQLSVCRVTQRNRFAYPKQQIDQLS